MSEIVLVTGATGFIAQHCILQLLEAGYQVRGTARTPGRSEEIAAILSAHLSDVARARLPRDFSVVAADLTSDAGWDDAVNGCRFVLHVASPFPPDSPKNEDELIIPARDGALRVLRAASSANVQRVVMTSSVAAIFYGRDRDHVFTEADWSNVQSHHIGAYEKSKTLAERAAWAFIDASGGQTSLATVNPALVLGPVMSGDFSDSVQVVQRLLTGKMPGLPRLGFNVVDVRDVADLHVRAMTDPKAAGQRFIAAADFEWMEDMAAILRRRLGARAAKVPTRNVPNFVVRLVALFDADLRTVTPGLGRRRDFSSKKARDLLEWRPRTAEATVVECAESLIAHGMA